MLNHNHVVLPLVFVNQSVVFPEKDINIQAVSEYLKYKTGSDA